MKLPRAERLVIDEAKLRDYLLSATHPIGRFKATFFARLGFTTENWRVFRDEIVRAARAEDASLGESTEFGQKYLVSAIIKGPSGDSAEITSVWIVLKADDRPRLVTVYPR